MRANGKLNKQLEEMMRKANRVFAAARIHIKTGDYDFASSRAYYAAFYSMEAVLLKQGLVYSKHSGVMSGFAQHFIGTAIFPKDFSKRIARLCLIGAIETESEKRRLERELNTKYRADPDLSQSISIDMIISLK